MCQLLVRNLQQCLSIEMLLRERRLQFCVYCFQFHQPLHHLMQIFVFRLRFVSLVFDRGQGLGIGLLKLLRC